MSNHVTFAEMGRALAHAWGRPGSDPRTIVGKLSKEEQVIALLSAILDELRGGASPWSETNFRRTLRVAGRKAEEDWHARCQESQDASFRAWEEIRRDRAPVPAILMSKIEAHLRAHAYQFASGDSTYTQPSCFSERTFGLHCLTGRWWGTTTATHKAYVAWQKDTKRLRDKNRRKARREKTQ
jgi:hypothetical protein